MIPLPVLEAYTIYTKRDCMFCDKVKHLLRDKKIVLVECDDIDRDEFLEFIDNLTPYCHRTFPYVFKNKVFIGGFTETEQFENENENKENLCFYEDDF